ncbi:MAG: formylglycine-generating enzyme family protein [Rubripirellula sp.]|nr:formylglycine-generating enzyme family protein [Rubripirellula sp.]
MLVSTSLSQDIKFETADKKFSITGKVAYFVAKGKLVDSPSGDEEGLAVVIIRPDGEPTAPVPIEILSTRTKLMLFKDTLSTRKEILSKSLVRNSIGMQLKRIPAGSFTMGSENGANNEKPAHKVTLTKPFMLGVHEVTQEQYQRVMGSNPSKFKGSQYPVEQVYWGDAIEFCRKLSALPAERSAGRVYRLPTEAQWEYAFRAGSTAEYGFGDDASDLGQYAWFRDNSGQHTHPVGQKQPNAWGLYDMQGNVSELCNDWSGSYPSSSVTDPKGPGSGSVRVTRGSGWGNDASRCRSAFRGGIKQSYRVNSVGFRVVCVSSGP